MTKEISRTTNRVITALDKGLSMNADEELAFNDVYMSLNNIFGKGFVYKIDTSAVVVNPRTGKPRGRVYKMISELLYKLFRYDADSKWSAVVCAKSKAFGSSDKSWRDDLLPVFWIHFNEGSVIGLHSLQLKSNTNPNRYSESRQCYIRYYSYMLKPKYLLG